MKQVLAMHDIASFGRASLVPVIAALSAAGHQCVPLPTAAFSTHMALPGWVSTDLNDFLLQALAQYKQLALRFDAIYAGYLNSEQQIDCVARAVQWLKDADGLALIDPVMGDGGKLYTAYTPALCARMRQLCRTAADILTPNVTEAAVLLEFPPDTFPEDINKVQAWAERLHKLYHAKVVLTGISFRESEIGVACFDGNEHILLQNERIGGYFPGTGDLFDSVLLGGLLNGQTLEKACRLAMAFVQDSIACTVAADANPLYGVQFEPLLGRLAAQHRSSV